MTMKWINISRSAFIELVLLLLSCTLFYLFSSHVELAERLIEWFQDMEQYELDEFVPTSLFALVLLAFYSLRRWKESRIQFLQKEAAEAKVKRLAYYDPLTELPNRTMLNDRLRRAISRCEHTGTPLALFYLDLDGFKKINDSLGHEAGDRYLRTLAQRLSKTTRPIDTLARHGGDEFVLVVQNYPSENHLLQLAETLLEQVTLPVDLGIRDVSTSASIGVALYPSDGLCPSELLKHADIAMYQAKAEGRNRLHFFSEALNRDIQETLELESALEQALRKEELSLAYQPQYDSRSLQMTGVEALARWTRNDGSVIGPDRFIPIAEESGLIGILGDWVLKRACTDAVDWGLLRLAVNLSPMQLQDVSLPDKVQRILNDTGFPPERLELEITETSLVDESTIAQRTLHALAGMGIGISMDDFGTGYSSLTYLKRYPIRQLKVDRSFIHGLDRNSSDLKLMKAIVRMSSALGVQTVAEGVENEAQMALLQQMGCQLLQGYLLSRPVPPGDIPTLMALNATPPAINDHHRI